MLLRLAAPAPSNSNSCHVLPDCSCHDGADALLLQSNAFSFCPNT